MLKKLGFAFMAALVLANASLASTQPASASPNAEQGLAPTANARPYGGTTWLQQAQENAQRAQQNSDQ